MSPYKSSAWQPDFHIGRCRSPKARREDTSRMADFAQIRARAAKRKGGEAELSSLLGPAPDNAAVAEIADDRILSVMAERVFAAGFVWRVIEQKWPGFEEAFLHF